MIVLGAWVLATLPWIIQIYWERAWIVWEFKYRYPKLPVWVGFASAMIIAPFAGPFYLYTIVKECLND